ncbi:MAG TPA: phenylalanine--tRNA ligase beta subunit-related protein [Longimicrobiales bacterium]
MSVAVTVEPHPSLRTVIFETLLGQPLAETKTPEWLTDLLRPDASAPMQRTEELRSAVRDMLRHGGYKPTGRGKPASEYLVRTAEEGGIRSINLVVDVCNVVSLHSGLPISLIDLDLAKPPLRVAIADAGTKYVFNASGQEIDVDGLVCLHDADGPCANAVKDSQRTKTRAETVRTLSVIWGCAGFERQLDAAYEWYAALLRRVAEETHQVKDLQIVD